MPAHEVEWLEAAADVAETAQLGEFRATMRHTLRYVILSFLLAVIGWLLTVAIIWGIQSGTAPAWARRAPEAGAGGCCHRRRGAFICSHVMGSFSPGSGKNSKRVSRMSGRSLAMIRRCGSEAAKESRSSRSLHTEKVQKVRFASSASSA
jgi:hypothetical protein